jgi:hypothetical protein
MRVAPAIVLCGAIRLRLEKQTRGHSTPARVAQRRGIVLLADKGLQNQKIALQMHVAPRMAALWLDDYNHHRPHSALADRRNSTVEGGRAVDCGGAVQPSADTHLRTDVSSPPCRDGSHVKTPAEGTSKRGDPHLRTLSIDGAKSVCIEPRPRAMSEVSAIANNNGCGQRRHVSR